MKRDENILSCFLEYLEEILHDSNLFVIIIHLSLKNCQKFEILFTFFLSKFAKKKMIV